MREGELTTPSYQLHLTADLETYRGVGGQVTTPELNSGDPELLDPGLLTRPTTPASQRGNTKGGERGRESGPEDESTSARKKGPSGWGRFGVVGKILGPHERKGHRSRPSDSGE